MAAISTTVSVLAIIGLVVGLVVFFVVIWLLNGVLAPLRHVLKDLESAKTAPMLERGVPGTDQLAQTNRLARGVPDLALAYLRKLGAGPAPAAAPAPQAWTPSAPSAPSPPPPVVPGGDANLPAWKRYRTGMR
ncbi:MAG: hypothetical protein QOJ35_2576 [Solirubrobacteraceae bacterium]|nr:hypothetical protein [Solirubrobacteraceae bacterium]